ncbi:MAG: hypothetical protein AB8U31_04325, partial [Anaplasma ovis]
FTAIFFGAGKLMAKFAAGINGEIGNASTFECKGGGWDGACRFAARLSRLENLPLQLNRAHTRSCIAESLLSAVVVKICLDLLFGFHII